MTILHALSRTVFGPFEGRRRFQGYFAKLYAVSLAGMNYGKGDVYTTSGELEVMGHVLRASASRRDPYVLFDVGANTGEYSAALLDRFSSVPAFVHAFEPSTRTYAELAKRLGGRDRVALHNIGFSDANGPRALYAADGLSGLSSVYPRVLDHRNIHMRQTETVMLRTLDDFCREESIDRIDFLKLDVEGHEFNVLKGSERMLREGRISAIQWEFGGSNINLRTYFRDFFYLLNDTYRIFRIVKDGLYPMPKYWEGLEIFDTVNYFAERKS